VGSATLLLASGTQKISSKDKKFLMILVGRRAKKTNKKEKNEDIFYVLKYFLFRGLEASPVA
jgi:hypothetical protein